MEDVLTLGIESSCDETSEKGKGTVKTYFK